MQNNQPASPDADASVQLFDSLLTTDLVEEFFQLMKSIAAKVDLSLIDLSRLPNGIICGPQFGHEALLG